MIGRVVSWVAAHHIPLQTVLRCLLFALLLLVAATYAALRWAVASPLSANAFLCSVGALAATWLWRNGHAALGTPLGTGSAGWSSLCTEPRAANTVRFVCISDTHNDHESVEPLPEGDVLLHAGDFTYRGTAAEVRKSNEWLGPLLPVTVRSFLRCASSTSGSGGRSSSSIGS